MALPVDVDATWLNPGSVQLDAGELRGADAAMFGGDGTAFGVSGGIVRHGDNSALVTVDGSDNVTIQPAAFVIPGNDTSRTGPYRFALQAAATGSLAARNATNPRIDLVVARALDTDVVPSHGAYKGRVQLISGTPAASPVAPSLPTMAVELGRITVPATGGGSASVDLSFRSFAYFPGGELLVATASRLPASAPKYQAARAVDTGFRYRWNGTSWDQLDTGWINLSLAAGFTSLTVTPAVKRSGDWVHFRGFIAGTWAANTGYTVASAGAIPAALRPSAREDFPLVTQTGTAAIVKCEVGTDGSITVRTASGTAPTTYLGLSSITYVLG